MGEESSRGREERKERNNDYEYDDDEYESSSSSTASCGCFMGLCYSWRRPNNGYTKMMNGEEARDNKVKGFLGGQKWKKYRLKMKMMNKKSRSNKVIFQYDPKSYALNFADGTHDHYLAFSARYAQHPSPLQGFPNAI